MSLNIAGEKVDNALSLRMPGLFFCIRWMKIMSTRKAGATILLVIGAYLVISHQQHSWFFETKNESEPDQVNETQVNETWTALRKVLLGDQQVSKVIILAHARGGSTLCSDVFNIESQDTVLWYEALHGFYSSYLGVPHANTDTMLLYYSNLTRRPADYAKRNELANYLTQLMTCDFEKLPVEQIAMTPFMKKSAMFKDLVECSERLNIFDRFVKCQDMVIQFCYHEELAGVSQNTLNKDLVSSFKCVKLLPSIRRLKSTSAHRVTIRGILRSYFNDHDPDGSSLGLTVYSVCPQLKDASGNSKEQFTSTSNTTLKQMCQKLASKLDLFIKHDQCLESINNDLLACRRKMAEPCRRSRLTAAEFQRVFIADLEPFIQQMPDIHVVHYVRDPRAVSVSRADNHVHTVRASSTWTAAHEAALLCDRMRYDIEQKKRLQQIYPGSIITVRYEDLVLDPEETVTRMYEFFGRPVPRGLHDWVNRTMHARSNNGVYGVERADGKRQLSKWRSEANADDIDVMTQLCDDVLREYHYDL